MAMKWVAQMPVPETKAASASQAERPAALLRACSRIEKAVSEASRQITRDEHQTIIVIVDYAGVDTSMAPSSGGQPP